MALNYKKFETMEEFKEYLFNYLEKMIMKYHKKKSKRFFTRSLKILMKKKSMNYLKNLLTEM
nr:hypothetical protein [Spiroplasma clarkii]